MLTECKIFNNVTSQWKEIMQRVYEQKLVVASCQNDLLVSALPKMQEDLE